MQMRSLVVVLLNTSGLAHQWQTIEKQLANGLNDLASLSPFIITAEGLAHLSI